MGKKEEYKNKKPEIVDYESLLGSKVPPHSKDAEMALLGSMMLDKIAISKAVEIIDADSFYDEIHKNIYLAIISLFEKGHNVDIVTLSEELNKRDQLEFIGGTYYLTEIDSKTPTSANAEHYAHIIQEKFLKRSLIATAGGILVNGYDDTTDALEEVDKAESEIFKIAEKRFSRTFRDMRSLAHETMDIIAKLRERDHSGITGVPSGFKKLDEKLGGFQNSDLIIIAGRPSSGKTALALSVARNAAVEYRMPVGVFSIEMSDISLVMRLVSAEARIDAQRIRTGEISQKEMGKVIEKIGQLSTAPLFIDDSPSLSVMELRAKCRRLKAEHQVKLIIIDYLQLMQPPKADSREREISIISRSLKQLAKELDIPIISLAQLNRSVETRADKRPLLSDLRESGSIEQDADVVLFIYRPEAYGIKTYPDDKSPTENTAEVIIGKQRNGPIGQARLAYLKEYARFENLEIRYDEPPPYDGEISDDEPF